MMREDHEIFVEISEKYKSLCSSGSLDKRHRRHAEVEGLGLGLARVKALIENMGGEITPASQQGYGARCAFLLSRPSVPTGGSHGRI
jgi:light-regulated signal transduction histidine kinase (bacteriophytochrome)